MMMMMMTAVPRVSAAQPDAFWLACDTLFVHDAARVHVALPMRDNGSSRPCLTRRALR
jgi:hypothetical protein